MALDLIKCKILKEINISITDTTTIVRSLIGINAKKPSILEETMFPLLAIIIVKEEMIFISMAMLTTITLTFTILAFPSQM